MTATIAEYALLEGKSLLLACLRMVTSSYYCPVELGVKCMQAMWKLHSCWCRGLNCFTPNINLVRDPRWGRNSETYGEDPMLTAEIAVAFVTGLQGNDSRYLKVQLPCLMPEKAPLHMGWRAHIFLAWFHISTTCQCIFSRSRYEGWAHCCQIPGHSS